MWYISTSLLYRKKTKNSDFFYKKESDKNSDFFFFLKKSLSVERVYLYGVSVQIMEWIAREICFLQKTEKFAYFLLLYLKFSYKRI
nr:MAG TPA: hypothetical protein [Caudoviricetes sp.]